MKGGRGDFSTTFLFSFDKEGGGGGEFWMLVQLYVLFSHISFD